MDRRQGLSVRIKLTLSYVGFLMIAGTLLLVAAWVFLMRGTPNTLVIPDLSDFRRVFDPHSFGPVVFVPAAVLVLGFLLVFGLVGGWILMRPRARPCPASPTPHAGLQRGRSRTG